MEDTLIITCSECGTSFRVKSQELEPGGRFVRCSCCGYEWLATTKETTLEKDLVTNSQTQGALEGLSVIKKSYPHKKVNKIKIPKQESSLPHWLMLILLSFIVIFAALVSRPEITQVWPDVQKAYDCIGLYDYSKVKVTATTPKNEEQKPVILVSNLPHFNKYANAYIELKSLDSELRKLNSINISLPRNDIFSGDYLVYKELDKIITPNAEYLVCEVGNTWETKLRTFLKLGRQNTKRCTISIEFKS